MLHYSWTEFHGAVTHFPIALLLTATFFDVCSVIFRKPVWRHFGFSLLVLSVISFVPTLISGWIAGNSLYGSAPQPPDIFLKHRLFAFTAAGLATILLIWRIVRKDHGDGPVQPASIALSIIIAGVISYTGFLGGKMVFGSGDAEPSVPTATAPAATKSAAANYSPEMISQGKTVYANNGCRSCHSIDGVGGHAGPNLSREGTRNADIDWQIEHLKNPQKFKPNSSMPAYSSLSDSDLKALATYLASRK